MSIDDIRRQIDELDDGILDLLSRRAEKVLEIGCLKQRTRREVFDPARERRILDRLVARNAGPLDAEAVRGIFGAIIAAHRMLEKDLVVAYYGPAGTFTHLAATRKFGPADLRPYDSIGDVFQAVEKKEADLGVVPVENSIGGVVPLTLDAFLESKLRICAEIYVDIEQYLLTRAQSLEEIRRVYSHPQPLAQCRLWLRANLPRAELIPMGSTSASAERAAAEPDAAAIGPALAGELHDLPALAARIQDLADNRTRFVVIGRRAAPASGKDKTSLVFSLPHESGTLYRSLAVLANHQINMTFIQSHPTKQTQWEYMFFVDVQGHADTPEVARALDELRETTLILRVLGSYPEAEPT
jgi:chorismate mutase/prephenate dehydratase